MSKCLPNRGVFLGLVWIILFLLYQTNGVQGILRGPPRLTPSDQKSIEVARLRTEFRLHCPVESDPPPIVDWFKDGEDITPAWSRFKRTSKTLRIRPVQAEDSGIYKCKGVNGFGSQTVRIRVNVVEDAVTQDLKSDRIYDNNGGSRNQRQELSKNSPLPSAPIFTPETLEQSENPLHLLAGNSIQLRCDAKGFPTPKISWLKNGTPIGDKLWKFSNWKLLLTKLELEDSGTYECIARNSLGRANSSIRLEIAEVVEKRRPELASDFPANVTIPSGSVAMMECVVQSGFTSMPPHIKWLKRVAAEDIIEMKRNRYNLPRLLPADNTHVLVIQEEPEDKIRIVETRINGTFVSKLIISKTDHGDEGTYICLASNSQGYTFKEANLTVLGNLKSSARAIDALPLPLIAIGLSIIIGLILIGSAKFLRKYHERNQKQLKQASCRLKLATSVTKSSPFQTVTGSGEGWEQSQLLVSTAAPSTSSSSPSSEQGSGHSGHFHSHHHHHHHHQSIPPVKYETRPCSCSSAKIQPFPYYSAQSNTLNLTKFEPCCRDGFHKSSEHSLHFGHWT